MSKDFLTDAEMAELEKKHKSSAPDFISDEDMAKLEAPQNIHPDFLGPVKTMAKVAADTATGGYYPQISAVLQGNIPGSDSYVRTRDESIQSLASDKAENPVANGLGTGAGILGAGIAGGLAVGAATKTLPLAARAATAGAVGLGSFLAQNPGDIPGEVNPIQAQDRLNMVSEHPVAATASTMLPMVMPAVQGLSEGDIPANRAFSALDPRKRLAKEAIQSGDKELGSQIGSFALKNNIVGGVSSHEKMYDKASEIAEGIGKQIGDLNKKASAQISSAFQDPQLVSSPQIQDYLTKTFTPDNYKQKILGEIGSQLQFKEGSDRVLSRVSDYLDILWDKYGSFDVEKLQKLRTSLGNQVKDWSKSNSEIPEMQQAFKVIRGNVAEAADNEFNLAEQFSKAGDSAKIKDLRNQFSLAQKISDNSLDRAAGDASAKASSIGDVAHILGGKGRLGSMAAGATNQVVNNPAGPMSQIPQALMSTVSRNMTEPKVEGYPISQTMPVDAIDQMKAGDAISKSNLPPTERANRLNLLNKHKRVYLDPSGN